MSTPVAPLTTTDAVTGITTTLPAAPVPPLSVVPTALAQPSDDVLTPTPATPTSKFIELHDVRGGPVSSWNKLQFDYGRGVFIYTNADGELAILDLPAVNQNMQDAASGLDEDRLQLQDQLELDETLLGIQTYRAVETRPSSGQVQGVLTQNIKARSVERDSPNVTSGFIDETYGSGRRGTEQR